MCFYKLYLKYINWLSLSCTNRIVKTLQKNQRLLPLFMHLTLRHLMTLSSRAKSILEILHVESYNAIKTFMCSEINLTVCTNLGSSKKFLNDIKQTIWESNVYELGYWTLLKYWFFSHFFINFTPPQLKFQQKKWSLTNFSKWV